MDATLLNHYLEDLHNEIFSLTRAKLLMQTQLRGKDLEIEKLDIELAAYKMLTPPGVYPAPVVPGSDPDKKSD